MASRSISRSRSTFTPKRPKSSYCSGINCNNSRQFTPQFSFFRFPKDRDRCMRWVINCRRQDLLDRMRKDPQVTTKELYQSNVLCAEHFEDKQFMNTDQRNRLIHSAVPTLFNIINPPLLVTSKKKFLKRNLEEQGNAIKNKKKKICSDLNAVPSSPLPVAQQDDASEPALQASKIQTDVNNLQREGELPTSCESLQPHLQSLKNCRKAPTECNTLDKSDLVGPTSSFNETEAPTSDKDSSEKRDLGNSLRCKYCRIVLDNRVYLEAHLHNAHGQNLEQDSVLSKLTTINSELQPLHGETVADLKSVNHDSSSSSSSVMKDKDRKENYGKSCTQTGSVSHHMWTHAGGRSFKCNICGKTFDSRNLTSHTLTHKPLKCFQCSEKFGNRRQLFTHVRDHFKGNDICKDSFHTEGSLLVDNECNPKVKLDDIRKQELLFYGREKPYKCVHCKRAYCHKRDLKRHHSNCHPQLEYHA